jgi:hypothetical protein
MYGRILSVRFVLLFIVRSPYSKNLNKNNEDVSILFARQSKWGVGIDGERDIKNLMKNFATDLYGKCTGTIRQNTLKPLQHQLFAILHLSPSAKSLSLFYLRGFT